MSENLALKEMCIPSNFQHRNGKKWLCEAFLNLKRIGDVHGPKMRMLWQKDICLLLEYFHHQKAYLFKLPKHGDLSQAVQLPFSNDSGFEITGSLFFKKQVRTGMKCLWSCVIGPFLSFAIFVLIQFLICWGDRKIHGKGKIWGACLIIVWMLMTEVLWIQYMYVTATEEILLNLLSEC